MSVVQGRDGGHVLVVLGGCLVVVGGLFYWENTLLAGASLNEMLFDLFTHVVLPTGVLVIGWVTFSGPLGVRESRQVTVWSVGGFLLLAVLVVWANLDSLLAGSVGPYLYDDLVVFGSLGGVFGGVAGTNRAHAAQNRRLVELAEEQRETLAFLTRLLGHDLRNDLSILTGATDLLETHVDDEGEEWLSIIEERTTRALDLLDRAEAISVAVDEPIDAGPVSLVEVLDREARDVESAHPETRVTVEVDEDLTVVAGELLSAVFANLFSNAIRHNTTENPRVEVTAESDGETVTVRVADNGPGIPDGLKGRVFEMGEHDPSGGGSGLGLYLVDRLVERFGGSITVGDNDPQGAVFEVRLPRA